MAQFMKRWSNLRYEDVLCCSVSLNNDQRRNLGSIAKILQAAAMKKGFGDEAPHLVELNSYIVASHDKFKQFFMECCRVPEPVSPKHLSTVIYFCVSTYLMRISGGSFHDESVHGD